MWSWLANMRATGWESHPLGQMEPRYQSLMVALVPQILQVPPPPFDKEALQRVFGEVIRHHPYQGFEFIFDGRGAQFSNSEDDYVELRPALLRVQAKMNGPEVLPVKSAAEKAERILRIAAERLEINIFVQCAIQVVASVDAPGEDAQAFVADHLLKDAEQADVLGPGFFGGGVRFRRLRPEEGMEDSLSIEPSVQDDALVFLEYQANRTAIKGPLPVTETGTWAEDALEFLSGPTIQLLST